MLYLCSYTSCKCDSYSRWCTLCEGPEPGGNAAPVAGVPVMVTARELAKTSADKHRQNTHVE
jgi:hypothetical protein